MKREVGTQYILNGAIQQAYQWDGTEINIQSKETLTRVKRRLFRNDLYRVESDGRIIALHKSRVDRYFRELEE